jgi:hypothetical protein
LLERADGLEALRGYQPDLGVAVGRKRGIFKGVVQALSSRGYELSRLDAAARIVVRADQSP